MTKPIKAWYFSTSDKKLRYSDGRKIQKGVTHKIKLPGWNQSGDLFTQPVAYHYGLHASLRILNALDCAVGPIIWRVELSGKMDKRSDKIAAESRKYLDGIDGTEVLRRFARREALDVAHIWHAPNVVLDYLKTGDEGLRDAAWAAAWAAARDAAWDAARARQNKRLASMVVAAMKHKG